MEYSVSQFPGTSERRESAVIEPGKRPEFNFQHVGQGLNKKFSNYLRYMNYPKYSNSGQWEKRQGTCVIENESINTLKINLLYDY